MRSSRFRQLAAVLTTALLLAPSTFAFSFPLSEESVREAYFLGQRRDESMALFLARYKHTLRPPETGPYISSVELLTPFAELVRLSSQRVNYSAQQAAKEHHRDDEIVAITIEIQLTDSYGALIAQPTSSRSGSPMGYRLRYSNFWKDFDVEVLVDDKSLEPTLFTGEPNYRCVYDGGCILTGATLRLELPAKLFDSDSATVHVTPPEGAEVFADFNLSSLR
jgi:hypothetical protein